MRYLNWKQFLVSRLNKSAIRWNLNCIGYCLSPFSPLLAYTFSKHNHSNRKSKRENRIRSSITSKCNYLQIKRWKIKVKNFCYLNWWAVEWMGGCIYSLHFDLRRCARINERQRSDVCNDFDQQSSIIKYEILTIQF